MDPSLAVSWIRICMFLGLLDPYPSLFVHIWIRILPTTSKKVRKALISSCSSLFWGFLYLNWKKTVFRILIHWAQIRIQHFRLNTNLDPDPDPGFWWLNIEKNLQLKKIWILFFWSKIAIYLSLGHHKGRPSNRRSLQPSTENIQPFKTEKKQNADPYPDLDTDP